MADFIEIQRASAVRWAWPFVIGLFLFIWLISNLHTGAYQKIARFVAILALVLGSWMVARGKLVIEVGQDAVRVGPIPFTSKMRTIALADIASAEAVTYDPIREYGGWGYRISPHGIAFNMDGNQGVQLVLRSDQHILLGSQKAQALAAAINQARSKFLTQTR